MPFSDRLLSSGSFLCQARKERVDGQETKYDRTNGELLSSKGSQGSHEHVGSKETLQFSVIPKLSFHRASLGILMFNLHILPTRVVFHKKGRKSKPFVDKDTGQNKSWVP